VDKYIPDGRREVHGPEEGLHSLDMTCFIGRQNFAGFVMGDPWKRRSVARERAGGWVGHLRRGREMMRSCVFAAAAASALAAGAGVGLSGAGAAVTVLYPDLADAQIARSSSNGQFAFMQTTNNQNTLGNNGGFIYSVVEPFQ